MTYKNANISQDLLNRTQRFSEKLIQLVRKLPEDPVNSVLVYQVVKSGTSIGANYREACEAESSKDFVHKIRISKKEARETRYWLKLLLKANPKFDKEIKELVNEATEFLKIFSTISSKFKKKDLTY